MKPNQRLLTEKEYALLLLRRSQAKPGAYAAPSLEKFEPVIELQANGAEFLVYRRREASA